MSNSILDELLIPTLEATGLEERTTSTIARSGDADAPYIMSETTSQRMVSTIKAYRNDSFMESHAARQIRIMCEFEEPAQRLSQSGVMGTILFFGSARAMSPEDYARTENDLIAKIDAVDGEEKTKLQGELRKLQRTRWMGQLYGGVQELARRLTEWATNNETLRRKLEQNPPMYARDYATEDAVAQPLLICTGGGPGFMEAANRGARQVPGAQSMGMAISLTFEKGINHHVSPSLAFEFHYFFTRKFWMMYCAKALVIAPGGFGTFDELFEMLTLKQTGKVKRMPIVLFGASYWKTVLNWQALADLGTISQDDIDDICFTDSVEEAFQFVTSTLEGHLTGVITRGGMTTLGATALVKAKL